jgi:hypothetical protein
MRGELEALLGRARARLAGASAGERVLRRDVVWLEAELGRPLPRVLALAWEELGAPRLAALGLWSPRSIAGGLPMAERWLDQGLLPFASTTEGDALLLRLAGTSSADEDPAVVLAVDFPRRAQIEVGPLSRVLAAHLLVHLLRATGDEVERRALETRLERIDRDGRLRDPIGWDGRTGTRAG